MTRLTDNLGVMGISDEHTPDEKAITTAEVDVNILLDAASILETLGWRNVEITVVESNNGKGNGLHIKPANEAVFESGEQAGLLIAGRTQE